TTITELSRDGVIAGTVRYMAPEALDGKPADARSDIFSFGAVVYEMLTGKRAFSGDSEARVIAAIMHEEPPPLATVRADVPRELDAIVRTCLAKNADDRWQSAGDLARQLERVAAAIDRKEPERAPRVHAPDTDHASSWTTPTPRTYALAALVVLVIVAIAAY